ncbi:Thiosulfate sulfurtransferase GlpE [Hyphomicrobium sp. ghe19]|nr:Thiosulfate sulfurtransferase GlpE [Hyphomicrobium sp. ghe19]
MPIHRFIMKATCVTVKVAAFYKFVEIDEPQTLQASLRELCAARGILGTILIASEGINSTVSGAENDIDALIEALVAEPRFSDLVVKYSEATEHPFQRLKVKVKKEIVTFGVPDARPSVATGTFVEPEAWNALIADPDVLVIDTRNDYEFQVGTFDGALNPETGAFNEFPDYVKRALSDDPKRKIAMFCTGGIRCEKASAFMLREGFPNVYQLNGGILRYLEQVAPEESLWRGECFVFDERVAVEHGVREGNHTLCSECGFPIRRSGGDSETAVCDGCREAMVGAD